MNATETMNAIAAETVRPLPVGAVGKAEKEAHDLADRRRRAAGLAGQYLTQAELALVALAGQGAATEEDGIALRAALATARDRLTAASRRHLMGGTPTVTPSRHVDAHNEVVAREVAGREAAVALLEAAAAACPPDMRGARRNAEIEAKWAAERPAPLPDRKVMVYEAREGGVTSRAAGRVQARSQAEALEALEAAYNKAGLRTRPGVGCFYRGQQRVDAVRIA